MGNTELELKLELNENLKKLNELCRKGGKIIEQVQNDEIECYEGIVEYDKNLKKQKEILDYTVVIVNNLFENNMIDLKDANEFYNTLYKLDESINNTKKQMEEWSE